MNDIWRCRSALSGKAADDLCFTVWNRVQPMSSTNLVAMTEVEAEHHENQMHDGKSLEEIYDQATINRVELRLTELRELNERYR